MAMNEEQYRATHPGSPDDKPKAGKKPWFAPNGGGVGYHPQTWQGVLVLVAAVAALVCIVLLIKGVI